MRYLEVKQKPEKNYLPIIIINAVLILLVIFRAFLCISIMDEPFNIGQAFRTIQGNVYLVENWDYFQTGDSFLTPFLYVFYKITGSTEGIILFARIVFIVLQIILAAFVFRILSIFFDRVHSLFAATVYITAVSQLIYSMWYDNWESYFRLIGLFLVFFVTASSDGISPKRSHLLIFAAGIAHACMVYAYPTMIIVYLYVLVFLFFYRRKDQAKKHNLWAVFYILGAASVFIIFLLYVLKIGVNNLFIFNDVLKDVGLASTGRADQFSASDILTRTKLLFIENFKLYLTPLIVFAVDIILLYVMRKSKMRVAVFCLLMMTGCMVHLLNTVFRSDSLMSLTAYMSLYAVPLYFLIRKKTDRKDLYKHLFVILFISSYLSGLAYAFTAMNGAVKFYAGARAGVIPVILLLGEVIKDAEFRIDSRKVFSIFTTLMIGFNVFALYSHSFDGNRPLECDTMIRSGIYKGIIDCKETAERYELAEETFKRLITEDDKTITCGPFATGFYFASDLKPDAINLYDPNNTELLFKYYDKYYGEPDLIVMHYRLDVGVNPLFTDFINTKYRLIGYTDSFSFYRRIRSEV